LIAILDTHTDNNNNYYKTSIVPISWKRIELGGAASTGVG